MPRSDALHCAAIAGTVSAPSPIAVNRSSSMAARKRRRALVGLRGIEEQLR